MVRTYFNLVIVFLVCGLWHGAEWSFVIWGLYHGIFLIGERVLRNKYNFEMSGIAGRVITFFIVMLGWVFFRADSLLDAFKIFSIMFGKQKLEGFQYYTFGYFIYPKIIVVSIFAFIVSFIPFYKLRERLNTGCVKGIVAIGVLIVSLAFISDASFTPFIYFQF